MDNKNNYQYNDVESEALIELIDDNYPKLQVTTLYTLINIFISSILLVLILKLMYFDADRTLTTLISEFLFYLLIWFIPSLLTAASLAVLKCKIINRADYVAVLLLGVVVTFSWMALTSPHKILLFSFITAISSVITGHLVLPKN